MFHHHFLVANWNWYKMNVTLLGKCYKQTVRKRSKCLEVSESNGTSQSTKYLSVDAVQVTREKFLTNKDFNFKR